MLSPKYNKLADRGEDTSLTSSSRFLVTSDVLTDAHYQAIGEIAAEFGVLEWLLGQCVVEIASISPTQGKIITSSMSVNLLIQVLQRLIYGHFGESEAKEDLSKIVGAIDRVVEIRNKILHGLWHESDKPRVDAQTDFNDVKRIKVSVGDFHLDDLSGVSEDVARITLAVSAFFEEHLTNAL